MEYEVKIKLKMPKQNIGNVMSYFDSLLNNSSIQDYVKQIQILEVENE